MSSRMTIVRRAYKRRLDEGEIINCGICGEPIPRKPKGSQRIINGGKGALSIDHIIERSKGGSTRIDNLQPTHLRCNFEKSNNRVTHLSEKLMQETDDALSGMVATGKEPK